MTALVRRLVLCSLLVACGPGVQSAKPAPTVRSPPVAAAPPVLAPAVPPPAEIGMLFSFASAERDIDRLAMLVPEDARKVQELPRSLRETLGPGLGSEVDLTRPAFIAIGDAGEELITFAVALKRPLGPDLPPELKLVPKRPGLQGIALREGSEHDWIGDSAACDVYDGTSTPQVLVCAPNPRTLGKLGGYVGMLGLSDTTATHAMAIDFFPDFLKSTLKDREATPWTVLARGSSQDVAGLRLTADYADTGLQIQGELRFTGVTAPLSRLLVSPTQTRQPPDFPEAPVDSLFGITLSSPDPTLLSMADANLLATALAPVVGSVSIAYGLDLPGAREQLAQWVEADAKDPAGAVAPGAFTPVKDWLLVRLEDDAEGWRQRLKELAKRMPKTGPIRVVAVANKADGSVPRGTIHLEMSESERNHWYVFVRGAVVLIAASADAATAKWVLRDSLDPSKGSPFQDYFRAGDAPQASGIGFLRPEFFAAQALNYESGYDRRRSLTRLTSVLEQKRATRIPAKVEYQISRAQGAQPGARIRLLMPNAGLESWLPEIFETFDL